MDLIDFFRTQFELFQYNPVASSKATVINGNARFTVLTDRVIRLEYTNTTSFVDAATLAFVNRATPDVSFTSNVVGNTLQIQTKYLSLSYFVGQPFSKTSLNITVKSASSPVYHFGDVDYGNLLGTIKSLDELGVTPLNCTLNAGIRVHDESLHCQWGLISRFGWTTVDDSDNYLIDPNSQWWSVPNPNVVDLYFFGHGSDYRGAIADYVLLGGKVAMPPRHAIGVMWSRWYNMNDLDVWGIVDDYQSRGLPLDNFILDMDWHTKQGWGGYSFDKSLFPLPEAVFPRLHELGVLTSGNLHDQDGMRPNEDQYVPFCKALGIDPSQNQTVEFAIFNETYALALEDLVLQPLEEAGFGDFWWIDWQQGGKQGGCPGGKANPTIWLNRLRATDKIRRGQSQRGWVLARWGGLGNHRYQVGFSGDVATVSWDNLAYQPYFSLTAANVLYGQWSHDIVGNSGQFELYTRWIQWGAHSSIMRSHDRGMASGTCAQDSPPDCGVVKIWEQPTPYFEASRGALQERHRLMPYLYTAQREYFDTGISIMRPMYYDFPNEQCAYLADQSGNFPQYMLGPSIMVSPIVSAGYNNDTLARQTIWIPPGTWIEGISGAVYSVGTGGMNLTRAYDISEVPVFYKAGSIVPRIPLRLGNTVGRAAQQYSEIDLTLYLAPGVTSGSTVLYEDDGISTDYATKSAFVNTAISFTRANNNLTVTIGAAAGQGYASFPSQRSYVIRYAGVPPQSVVVDGNVIQTWRFDGVQIQVVIEIGQVSTNAAHVVTVIMSDTSLEGAIFGGIKGQIARANLAKRTLDPSWSTPGAQTVEKAMLSSVASSGAQLSYWALNDLSKFSNLVSSLPQMFAAAQSEINGLRPNNNSFPPNALVQWWSSQRQDSCLCAHFGCNSIQAESGYTFVRIEGYIPDNGATGTTRLHDYWNPSIQDNFATTNASMPNGYSPAIFHEGSVFSGPGVGRVPLQTWWSPTRQDWLTVASPEGVSYAQANGYVLGNRSIGYVFRSAPVAHQKKDSVTVPTFAQWARASDLLRF